MKKDYVEIHEQIETIRQKGVPNAWELLLKSLRSSLKDLMRLRSEEGDGFRTLNVNLCFNIENPLVLSIESKRIKAMRTIHALLETNEAELSMQSHNGRVQSMVAGIVPGFWLTDAKMEGPGMKIASAFDELKTLDTSKQFFNADGFGEIWEVEEGKLPKKYTPESTMSGNYVSDSEGALRFLESHPDDKKKLARIWRLITRRDIV